MIMTIERAADDAPAHLYDADVRALRDKFAGQAMVGMITGYYTHDAANGAINDMSAKDNIVPSAWVAKHSFLIADEMLKARGVA